jgi:energy-converting hydrogenase Eha subunit B
VNWIGLLRSLQAEIVGVAGALVAILVVWLVVRAIIGRGAAGVTQTRLRTWADRGASLLALVIVGGMLWHVMTVTAVNRLPRQDVDGSPVYERMDAITKK